MQQGRETGATYYRKRAQEMRQKADCASDDDVRRSFLLLASNWDYLADLAEKSDTPH